MIRYNILTQQDYLNIHHCSYSDKILNFNFENKLIILIIEYNKNKIYISI